MISSNAVSAAHSGRARASRGSHAARPSVKQDRAASAPPPATALTILITEGSLSESIARWTVENLGASVAAPMEPRETEADVVIVARRSPGSWRVRSSPARQADRDPRAGRHVGGRGGAVRRPDGYWIDFGHRDGHDVGDCQLAWHYGAEAAVKPASRSSSAGGATAAPAPLPRRPRARGRRWGPEGFLARRASSSSVPRMAWRARRDRWPARACGSAEQEARLPELSARGSPATSDTRRPPRPPPHGDGHLPPHPEEASVAG